MPTTRIHDREELCRKHRLYRRTGDQRLREELVTGYSGLAGALASRFDTGRDHPEDLHQVALVGLLHAVDRFDPSLGVQFTTFAWATINGELKRHLRDRTWRLRVPRRLQEQSRELAQVADDLAQELGRPPSLGEVGERTGLSEKEILDARSARSADRMLGISPDTDGGAPVDVGIDETGYGKVEERQAVERLVCDLSPRDRRLLHLRFVEEMTQSEIGAAVGLSQMQVSRLLEQILRRLRTVLGTEWAPATR